MEGFQKGPWANFGKRHISSVPGENVQTLPFRSLKNVWMEKSSLYICWLRESMVKRIMLSMECFACIWTGRLLKQIWELISHITKHGIAICISAGRTAGIRAYICYFRFFIAAAELGVLQVFLPAVGQPEVKQVRTTNISWTVVMLRAMPIIETCLEGSDLL